MSNVSIFEKNWTDLVFEDRNKAYGAYVLRQENSRTTLIAFFSGILLLFSLLGAWLLFSSFGTKDDVKIDDGPIIVITKVHYPKTPETKKEVLPLVKKEERKETKKIEKEDLVNATIVKKEDNPDDVRTNKEVKENPTNNNSENGTSTGPSTPSAPSGPATTGTETKGTDTETIVKTIELDRLPQYPGGITNFYKYVGNNIQRPEVDENVTEMSVIMSFVIEKDGSMSDIKVLRSSDKHLEKEAIRVLKSLKVKWSPGYKDGEKMRTLYTLPIKVAI